MDLAASIQQVTEEVMLLIAKSLRQEYKISNLCLAGGVALNCVANGKLKRENREERIEEILVEAVPVNFDTQKPSSWAKWIRKIYETDPLTCCSKCGNQCGSPPSAPTHLKSRGSLNTSGNSPRMRQA